MVGGPTSGLLKLVAPGPARSFFGGLSCWLVSTWRIIPVSKWLITPIYKPFRPFTRGITPVRGLTNHGY